MAWTIADGLGWLPTYPAKVPHQRTRTQALAMVEPFAPATIPVPVVPGLLAFAPIYPDRVPHHKGSAARTELFEPLLFEAAIAPVSWLPRLPLQAPRHHAAQRPTIFEPPPGELIAIAQRMAWAPRYPGRVPHHRPPNLAGAFYTVPPEVAAAGILCVELVDGAFTVATVQTESVTGSTILQESVSVPTVLTEDLC